MAVQAILGKTEGGKKHDATDLVLLLQKLTKIILMYLESNSRFVLLVAMIFFISPYFLMIFQVGGGEEGLNQPSCNFEKTYQKLPKNRARGNTERALRQ